MCRITGIYDLNNKQLNDDILKMRDAMHHGGPDHAGVFIDGALAFGHRRLSIIDLSNNGDQPMHSSDSRYVLVYNGEIYNFKVLREELLGFGYCFKSESDTEVILNGFVQWGTLIFEKLNGMFAMAIYDRLEKTIILSRDYAGIKPLYYYLEDGKLYFASEIRAFNALNIFKENPDWQIYFLAFGHLPEPITTLKNVIPLQKGSYLTFKMSTGECEINVYNNFQFSSKITNIEEALNNLSSVLMKSVKRHLISDAPIGLFLSGGIDSSLLTILAEPILKDKLQTLSIVFEEEEFSEKKYQDIIIKQTGAKHKTYTVTKEQFLQAIPDIMDAMDQPSTDGINTYFISKYAKESGFKAVLSGLGADELFGGYNSFEKIGKFELLKKIIPAFVFKAFQLLKKDKYQKASFLAIPGPIGQYLFNRGFLCPKEISKILNISEQNIWSLLIDLNLSYKYKTIENQGSQFSILDSFNKASFIESDLYMQNQLLKDSDYMSMWHSIEIRVPFLDKELIKLSYQICPSIKTFNKQKKYLLIHSVGDLLPKAIWNRPKMGFTFPFQKWGVANNGYLKKFSSDGQEVNLTNETSEYIEDKFIKGEYSWIRYWATKFIK